uniref:Uncharacterized protein n=1 Tax=Ficus carica TaxID=3494 RepID=A0AA88J9H6_FICCA|nr:hypothetical protein TIFTF001_034776 [Ficus carica]GMN65737.1 hypothetical protein TIFTF001_034797 [Ficus carica]
MIQTVSSELDPFRGILETEFWIGVNIKEVRFFFVVLSPQKSIPKSAASTSSAVTNLNDAVKDLENAPQAPTTPSSSSSSSLLTTTSSAATSTTPSPLPKMPLLFASIFSLAS